MALGLTEKFDILQRSPHDFVPSEPPVSEPRTGRVCWLPSRYNVRATTTDAQLVVWNTYTGAMSVFAPEQRPTVEALLSRQGFEAPEEGGVKYLHDRGFLIREGTDEYQRLQLTFGRQHYRSDVLQLILLSSEDCNFRCKYCYEDFARGTMRPWVRDGVKRLVEGRIQSLRQLSIGWFGGEPLYGFEAIEDLAPFFAQIAEEHGVRLGSGMTTNGYLLRPEIADKLLSWRIRKFQITLDGPPESHDKSRPARDGRGTFATIFENLKSMRQRPDEFEIDLRVNFDHDNHPHLERFLDLVEEEFRGDSRFRLRFRMVCQWGGSNDDNLDVCGRNEGEDLQVELKREAARRGLTLTEDDDVRQLNGAASPWVCYAARPYHFVIGASGKVMKCTIDLDKHDRNVVGQITEEGDFQLEHDKLARWAAPSFEVDRKCQKCVVLPICNGISCPQRRMKTGRSPCISLRRTLKQELRKVAVVSGAQTARQVLVGAEQAREVSATHAAV